MSDTLVADDGKIECKLCGSREHSIRVHLRNAHPGVSSDDYTAQFPGAPLMSALADAELKRKLAANAAAAAGSVPGVASVVNYAGGYTMTKEALHDLFGLGAVAAALSAKKTPIGVTKLTAPVDQSLFVPDLDPNYIFPISILKTLMFGVEMSIPVMVHGHAGTGKSTIWEQIAARTGRPMLRVQHTNNMEESHVLGGWRVKNGETFFELGPLAYAMKYGLMYLADEYDRARPGVLALYQPVLEGKPLVIKEADPENRVIKPHPHFRIVATGNTNGTGDESGLYQGTIMQDAANYERFGITVEIGYMDKKLEQGIVAGQANVPNETAEKLVDFARMVREAFNNGKIGLPVSPRALINAAKCGKRLGSLKLGLELSYSNRLSRIDKEVVTEFMQKMGFE